MSHVIFTLSMRALIWMKVRSTMMITNDEMAPW